MANMLQSDAQATAALAAKRTDLNTCAIGLFTAPTTPLTVANLNANFGGGGFTEVSAADLTGYARQTPVFGAPSVTTGAGSISAGDISFTITAVVTPKTIYGWFVVDGAGNIRFAQAETPQVISVPGTYKLTAFAIADQAIP